ncbi:MAG: protein-export chaperone SecB [Sphingomonadaceae bacterium]|nr:protein-export chaperone SecB [Sphingomonadaceae bacterium]
MDETATPEMTANGLDQMPQVRIVAQYVKDFSFENPNAPNSFNPQQGDGPRIEVSVNVNARKATEELFEVELKFNVNANGDIGAIFAVELLYAGLFALKNVPYDALEPFLVVEAPRLIFPFARRIIADATRDGGFAPLMLDPIDFASMYLARMEQANGGGQLTDITVGNA